MINNHQILTRFSKVTISNNKNCKISIPNVNQEFSTINFESQVNNFQQQLF